MSKPEMPIDSNKPNLLNPLFNFSTFSGLGYYFGPHALSKLGDSIVKWVPTPLTATEFAVGGAINAAALSAVEYAAGTDGMELDLNKVLVATATLGAMFFITPHISKSLAQWTGVVLTTEKMYAVCGFNLVVKALTYAAYQFSHALELSSTPKIPTTEDEARNISYFQVSRLRDILEASKEDWNKLPLSIRVILNNRFAENGSDLLLPLHGFKSDVGKGLQKEEIEFLHQQVKGKTDFSAQEQAHMNGLFYGANLSPIGSHVSVTTLPKAVETDILALKADACGTLPQAQTEWIQLYYVFNTPKTAPLQELCDRMFELKIPAPTYQFAPSKAPDKPADLKSVKESEKYAISWFFGYFNKNQGEWAALSLKDRLEWHQAFLNEHNWFLNIQPTLAEVEGLTSDLTLSLHKHYVPQDRQSKSEEMNVAWSTLDVVVQRALNEKFDSHVPSLATRTIYPRTLQDCKKMSQEEIEQIQRGIDASAFKIELLTAAAKEGLKNRGVDLKEGPPVPQSYFTTKNVVIGSLVVAGLGVTCYFGIPWAMSFFAAGGNGGSEETPLLCKANEGEASCPEKSQESIELKGRVEIFRNEEKHVIEPGLKVDDTFSFEDGQFLTDNGDGTVCVGTQPNDCSIKMIKLPGVSSPFSVVIPPPPTPVLSIDGTSVHTLENELKIRHDGAEVTVHPGFTLPDGSTLNEGAQVSFSAEGNLCVGTAETPCTSEFQIGKGPDGVLGFTVMSPIPELSEAGNTAELDRKIVIKTSDGEVSLEPGFTLPDGSTLNEGETVSISDKGTLCVGADCVKEFQIVKGSKGSLAFSMMPPIPELSEAGNTAELDRKIIIKTSDGEVSLELGFALPDGSTLNEGETVSISDKGTLCVGADCAKEFQIESAEGSLTFKVMPPPVPVLTANTSQILDNEVIVQFGKATVSVKPGFILPDGTKLAKGKYLSFSEGYFCVGTAKNACAKKFKVSVADSTLTFSQLLPLKTASGSDNGQRSTGGDK